MSIKASYLGKGRASLLLVGEIGTEVRAHEVAAALRSVSQCTELLVTLDSCGGDCAVGFSICDALKACRAKKIVTLHGAAHSMAAMIALTGDEIEMAPTAELFLHLPTAHDFDREAEAQARLREITDRMTAVFARRTGRPASEFENLMRRETYLTAREAFTIGLVDRLIPSAEAQQNLARIRSNTARVTIALMESRCSGIRAYVEPPKLISKVRHMTVDHRAAFAAKRASWNFKIFGVVASQRRRELDTHTSGVLR